MLVTLIGKSLKGKNRVRELGSNWKIISQADTVQFSSKRGPWLLLQCLSNSEKIRWVHEKDDEHFKIQME